MEAFSNARGAEIVSNLIRAIQENKHYLSEIDGAAGDGDHGINMNKGFTMCYDELRSSPGNLAHGLKTLSRVLVMNIGGAMGPLYGGFFRAMARTCDGVERIDEGVFGAMLRAGEEAIRQVGGAEVGDKTMLDSLVPAVQAFTSAVAAGSGFAEALEAMKAAAIQGRDSTKDMIARIGRASQLGDRSRGLLDAGATSCCLILGSMADSVSRLISQEPGG
jgi:dihydroxyacetone kinase-like protein